MESIMITEYDNRVVDITKITGVAGPKDKIEYDRPSFLDMISPTKNDTEIRDILFNRPDDDWFKSIVPAKESCLVYDESIRDRMLDVDRAALKLQQSVKKGVQDTIKTGKAVVKPVKRTYQWIDNMINEWKDKDENQLKEKMADPHSRSSLWAAVKEAIKVGSFAKAGLLLNPIFLFIEITRFASHKSKSFRIRNEMIGEIKTEIQILDEKIKDADANHDTKEKYQMMRIRNELEKKLLRASGGKQISKIL